MSDLALAPGHHTAWAVTPVTAEFNPAESAPVEFDVVAPVDNRTATKTTLTAPVDPVADVSYPYTIRVSPSAGSTGRVELSTYDNLGTLYYLGVSNLRNGQATINASLRRGEHVIIARFAGDGTYADSETGVRLTFPVGPTAVANPPAIPVPATTPSNAAVRPATQSGAAELAYTGANPWPGLTLSVLLLAAGAGLIVARRKRYQS